MSNDLPTLTRRKVVPRNRKTSEQVARLIGLVPAELKDDENLIDLGLDSIRIMKSVEQFRRSGVEVTFAELAERPTVTDWWRLLSSRLTQQATAKSRQEIS